MFSGPPSLVQALPVVLPVIWLGLGNHPARNYLMTMEASHPLSNAKPYCDSNRTCRFSKANCIPQSCPKARIYRKQATLRA